MNNKYSKGSIIYATIGVCILVISILGSAYAYYVASSTSGNMSSKTASVKLDLDIENISTSATDSIMPIDGSVSNLNQAVKGWDTTTNNYSTVWNPLYSCTDENGYTVCNVYEITISNTGTESVNVSGKLKSLYGDNTPNISCNVMSNNVTVTSNSCLIDNSFTSGTNIAGGGNAKFYMVIYVNETGSVQNDYGPFSGVVSFSTANGNIEARF